MEGALALEKAMNAEDRAASEYLRVLKILTALVDKGKIPDESET